MVWLRVWCCCLLVLFAGIVMAQEKEGEEEVPEVGPAIYVPVKPAFVVNYGGPGKLKYMKLEISLRVQDTAASNAVRHHMPLIRDYLVREFSRLQDQDVDTQDGKENVRVAVLQGVKDLIKEEDGAEGIVDLFFNNFVIQR